MTFGPSGTGGDKKRYPLHVVKPLGGGRLGRFECSIESMTLESEIPQILMSQVIVVNCKHDLLRGVIEYTALGKQFAEVLPGAAIPLYTPFVTQHPLGTLPRYTISWLPPSDSGESRS